MGYGVEQRGREGSRHNRVSAVEVKVDRERWREGEELGEMKGENWRRRSGEGGSRMIDESFKGRGESAMIEE